MIGQPCTGPSAGQLPTLSNIHIYIYIYVCIYPYVLRQVGCSDYQVTKKQRVPGNIHIYVNGEAQAATFFSELLNEWLGPWRRVTGGAMAQDWNQKWSVSILSKPWLPPPTTGPSPSPTPMLSRADMRKVIQCMTNTAVAFESQVTETYNAVVITGSGRWPIL